MSNKEVTMTFDGVTYVLSDLTYWKVTTYGDEQDAIFSFQVQGKHLKVDGGK